jgi:hypothetical protein
MLSIVSVYPCLSLPPPPLRARFCALRRARFARSASASRLAFGSRGGVGGFGGLLRSGMAASIAHGAAGVHNRPRLLARPRGIHVEERPASH